MTEYRMPGSLEELLTPLIGKAYGLALRLTGNQADAEDVLQEAALSACRGFSGFQAGTNFKAWFFQILVNTFYTQHRRRAREGERTELVEESLFLYSRIGDPGLQPSSPDPARDLLGRMEIEQIAAALQRLPEEFRTVSALYFIDDCSYQEIAAAVGVPVGTVRSRLHRGRKMLQASLWKTAVEYGLVRESPGKPL